MPGKVDIEKWKQAQDNAKTYYSWWSWWVFPGLFTQHTRTQQFYAELLQQDDPDDFASLRQQFTETLMSGNIGQIALICAGAVIAFVSLGGLWVIYDTYRNNAETVQGVLLDRVGRGDRREPVDPAHQHQDMVLRQLLDQTGSKVALYFVYTNGRRSRELKHATSYVIQPKAIEAGGWGIESTNTEFYRNQLAAHRQGECYIAELGSLSDESDIHGFLMELGVEGKIGCPTPSSNGYVAAAVSGTQNPEEWIELVKAAAAEIEEGGD